MSQSLIVPQLLLGRHLAKLWQVSLLLPKLCPSAGRLGAGQTGEKHVCRLQSPLAAGSDVGGGVRVALCTLQVSLPFQSIINRVFRNNLFHRPNDLFEQLLLKLATDFGSPPFCPVSHTPVIYSDVGGSGFPVRSFGDAERV